MIWMTFTFHTLRQYITVWIKPIEMNQDHEQHDTNVIFLLGISQCKNIVCNNPDSFRSYPPVRTLLLMWLRLRSDGSVGLDLICTMIISSCLHTAVLFSRSLQQVGATELLTVTQFSWYK